MEKMEQERERQSTWALTKTEQNWTEFRSDARESWPVSDVCSERCQTTSQPLQASLRAAGLPACVLC